MKLIQITDPADKNSTLIFSSLNGKLSPLGHITCECSTEWAHGFAKANQFAASASQSASAITTTISRSNPNRRGFDPRATKPKPKNRKQKNENKITNDRMGKSWEKPLPPRNKSGSS
jgi:hypothetical protein